MNDYIRTKSYDRLNDILYITFNNSRGTSYADDSPIGFEIMRDWDTEEITGLMVYYPKRQMQDRQCVLEQLGFRLCLEELLN